MMIMMIERNRRQKVEEIKKIQESNGRVRCGGMKKIKRGNMKQFEETGKR
jgi:hypothetical protein